MIILVAMQVVSVVTVMYRFPNVIPATPPDQILPGACGVRQGGRKLQAIHTTAAELRLPGNCAGCHIVIAVTGGCIRGHGTFGGMNTCLKGLNNLIGL